MGAHALLANGGVMTGVGSHLVALAAKRHAVPFVVLVGLHKLSPLFPHDPSVSFNDFKVRLSLVIRWQRLTALGPPEPFALNPNLEEEEHRHADRANASDERNGCLTFAI